MLTNQVIAERFGVAWTLARICALSGGAFLVLAGLLFVILFKHVGGKVRRLSPTEAGYVSVYSAHRHYLPEPIESKGVGYGVELTANIDTLRKAARRGDWLTFWLWPALMSSACVGLWLLFMSMCMALDVPRFVAILATATLAPIFLIAWFMPWAAIYTKIDLGAEGSKVEVPEKP